MVNLLPAFSSCLPPAFYIPETLLTLKMAVFCAAAPCSLLEVNDVSEVLAASIIIALMTEAANTSQMSVNFYQTTRRNNPEDSHLQLYLCCYY
jgi:hypothetical protein